MRRFFPFAPLLPSADAKELPLLFSPSLDELILPLRQELCARHRNNFVRFSSFRPLTTQHIPEDAVERVRSAYEDCVEAGIIKAENKPGFFLLEISANGASTTGFVGMFALDSSPPPKSYETALDIDVRDRISQLEHLKVHTAPVTMGYVPNNGEQEAIDHISEKIKDQKPLIEFTTPEGATHRIWRVNENIHEVESIISHRRLVIIDGEDRWRAAQLYAQQAREKDSAPSPLRAYNYVLSWMVPFSSESVNFRAVHRAVRTAASPMEPDTLLEHLEDYFEIERYQLKQPGAKDAELTNLLDEMDLIGRLQHAYGLYIGDKAYYLLYLRDADAYESLVQSRHSRRWKRLDINILQTLVFENVLNLKLTPSDDLSKMAPTVNARYGVTLVDEEYAKALFMVNPPTPELLLDIAEAGEELPPRSLLLERRPLVGPIMASIGNHDYVSDSEKS